MLYQDQHAPILFAHSVRVIDWLRDNGANLFSTSDNGNALHWNCLEQDSRIIQRLLQLGLDPQETDREGKYPFEKALEYRRSENRKIMLLLALDSRMIVTLLSPKFVDRLSASYLNQLPIDVLQRIIHAAGYKRETLDGLVPNELESCRDYQQIGNGAFMEAE